MLKLNNGRNYPVCLDGAGNTPPEDVGGPKGCTEFLAVLSDPEHPEYEKMGAWGKMQGYADFDLELVNWKFRR